MNMEAKKIKKKQRYLVLHVLLVPNWVALMENG